MVSQDSPEQTGNLAENDNPRTYWSIREGRNTIPLISGRDARTMFVSLIDDFKARGMLQESFGDDCPSHGHRHGTLGSPITDQILLTIGRKYIWPLEIGIVYTWDDDTLLDVIEFMFDHVSTGISWAIAQTRSCTHFNVFDAAPARLEYRKRINKILAQMDQTYELTVDGQVRQLADSGMEVLLDKVGENLEQQDLAEVTAAIEKFHSRNSGATTRKDAVLNLIGVLERMKPDLKMHMLTKDEDALFNIANNFSLRHNNAKQLKDYDQVVWLPWLFYLYLNSIYLVSHLKQRGESQLSKS